jgi:hypothetical protein
VVVDRRVIGMAPPQLSQGGTDQQYRATVDQSQYVDTSLKSTRPGRHSQGEDDRSSHRDVSPRSSQIGYQLPVGDRRAQQHASLRPNRPYVSSERPRSDQGPEGPGFSLTGNVSGRVEDPGHTQTPRLRGLSTTGQSFSGQTESGHPVSGHQGSESQVSQPDHRTSGGTMSDQVDYNHQFSPVRSPSRDNRARSESPHVSRSHSGHQSSRSGSGHITNSGQDLISNQVPNSSQGTNSGHDSSNRRGRSPTRSPRSHRSHSDESQPPDPDRRRSGDHLQRSPSPVSPKRSRRRSRSRSRSPASGDEKDVMSLVKYTELIEQMAFYLGDDLPACTASPLPAPCRSAIRATKAVPDAVRPLPLSPLVTSSILKAQKLRLGFASLDISTQPPVHFIPLKPDRKLHTMPSFKYQYYKTEEDILQPIAAVLEPDASSLWGSKPPVVPLSLNVSMNDLNRTETVSRRTLLALNSCEWFLASLVKVDSILTDENATQVQFDDATLFSKRVKESIGMCLESIAENQTFLLSSLLLQKRETLLKGPSGAIHPGLLPFLRAQPLLNGTAIFGKVSELARDLQEANKADRTYNTMEKAVSAMSRSFSKPAPFSSARGASGRGASQPRARGFRGTRGMGRASPFSAEKMDFTTPSDQPQTHSARGQFSAGRGYARGRPGRGRPFQPRGGTTRRAAHK